MKLDRLDSELHLPLLILGLTAIIGTNAAASGARQDSIQQQDLRGTDYTDNRVEGPRQKSELPFYYNNNFECTKHQYAYGMYADMDFHCQVYHVCHNNRKETFLCPSGTLFNQRLLVCDHWHSVNCQNTPSFYYVNEQLGKVSNRTRFDSTDRPYSQRRFPQDYGQSYVPGHRTDAQGQQFPPYYSGSPLSPSHPSPTEAPRGPNRFSNHTQTGSLHPERQRGQGQPDWENRLAPGYGYVGQRQGGIGQRGPSLGVQRPGAQQNRGFAFTQQRTDRINGTTTWPADQRNTSQGFQYGRQPSRGYPESSLLGSRYDGQRSFTTQPDRATPRSPLHALKPPASDGGHLTSRVSAPGFSYDRQLPSTESHGQTSTGLHLDRGFTPSLSSGHAGRENVLYGHQQPQLRQPHHPFTTHGGQIHSQRSPVSSYDHQQPTGYGQQPPQGRGLGSVYSQQHSTLPPKRGEQPHFGTTGSPHIRDSPTLQNGHRQPYTTSGPVYGQQPIITDGRLSAESDVPGQRPGAITGEGRHQVDARGNAAQDRGQQNFTTGHHRQPTPGSFGTKPEFGYTSNRQQEGKPDRDSKSPQSWSRPSGNQPNRSQHGFQETVRYGWQKPGSPYYSFQQPQYRNVPFSGRIRTPQLASARGSIGSGADYDGSADKNLKPILVYQHHVPVSINGNNTGGANYTDGGQGVPVYKIYYVRDERKDTAAN